MTGDPIVLRGLGSFHIGGRTVEISGRPVATRALSPGGIPATIDPNDQYQVEAMYVQYFLPQSRKGKYPLLLWHGGGMTGVTYESTPDGREGWLNMFVRAGWDVYVCDSVERGRSSFAPPGVWGDEPIFLPKRNPFERFRIGPRRSEKDAGTAGQSVSGRGLRQLRQAIRAALGDDRCGHHRRLYRAAGKAWPLRGALPQPGRRLRLSWAQARPDLVKALVAVEPAVAGDIDEAGKLQGVPVLMLYGDFIEDDKRWPKMRRIGLDYAAAVRAGGGSVDVIDLPEAGIKGNSHFPMLDRNNDDVFALIETWLADKGLTG